MWMSFSPDLRHWGDHTNAARGGVRRGLVGRREDPDSGPPPLETTEGWLVDVPRRPRHLGWPDLSCRADPVGVLDDPRYGPAAHGRVGLRSSGARTSVGGDVDKVVFPTGWVHDPETDLLSMYYGAGDSVIALATARLRDVLDHLATAPMPEHRRLDGPHRQLVGPPTNRAQRLLPRRGGARPASRVRSGERGPRGGRGQRLTGIHSGRRDLYRSPGTSSRCAGTSRNHLHPSQLEARLRQLSRVAVDEPPPEQPVAGNRGTVGDAAAPWPRRERCPLRARW